MCLRFLSILLPLSLFSACLPDEGMPINSLQHEQDSLQVQTLLDSARAAKAHDVNRAVYLADSVLSLCEKNKQSWGAISAYMLLGNIQRQKGNNLDAYKYQHKALELAYQLHDTLSLGRIYGNLGNIYYSGLDPYSARDYYQKALDIFTLAADTPKMLLAIKSIANTHMDFAENEKAEQMYDKAYEIYSSLRDTGGMCNILLSKSLLYHVSRQDNKAEAAIQQSESLRKTEQLNDPEILAKNLIVKAHLLLKQKGNPQQIEALLQEAGQIIEEQQLNEDKGFYLLNRARFAASQGKYPLSIQYYEATDSLHADLESMKSRHELARIHNELNSYATQQELKLLKKETELAELENRQQKLQLTLLSTLLLLLVVILYLLLQRGRNIKRKNQLLQKQKKSYGDIFNLLSDGIAILTSNGLVLEINPSMCRLLQVDAKELEGKALPGRLAELMEGMAEQEVKTIRLEQEDSEDSHLNLSFTHMEYLEQSCRLVLLSDVSNVFRLQENERQIEQYEYSRKISELKIWALRSQINPHFIFNALNSIQYFILNGQNEEAGHYLSKFSKLIRSIFDTSDHKHISLSQEIQHLQLYIDIEKLRFGNDFHFDIRTTGFDHGEIAKTYIPPMILQPFVENALWHGLNHKKGEKHLLIEISKEVSGLKCIIEDNGIGREASQEMKKGRVLYHQSAGMSKTMDRIQLLNQANDSHSSIEVSDLYDAEGKAAGTRVTVLF